MFTKKRGAIGAFFGGTAQDPDPLLVITTAAVVEYADGRKAKWQPATFKDDLSVIQQSLEAYRADKALSQRR